MNLKIRHFAFFRKDSYKVLYWNEMIMYQLQQFTSNKITFICSVKFSIYHCKNLLCELSPHCEFYQHTKVA